MGIGVVIADAPQFLWILLGRVKGGQDHGLIALEAGRFVDWTGMEAAKIEAFARTDDEEGRALVEHMKARKIEIAPVHDVDGARFGDEMVEYVDVVKLALGDLDESGDVAAQIQQRVELDGCFSAAEVGPRKQGKTQIDGSGIQRVDGLVQFDGKIVAGIQSPSFVDQDLSKISIDSPVSRFVGVSQAAASDSTSKAHVVEFVVDRTQSHFDISQALPIGHLGKGQAKELLPA